MRELTGKPESWTPREQAAVVLNALYFASEALWNCEGSDAGGILNDPLANGLCPPTIWFDDDGCPVATPINEAFCRPIQDRLAILRSPMFARWLESRGASNVSELLSRIQVELEKSDRLIDALHESGQIDASYRDELLQRRARREEWPADLLTAYRAECDKAEAHTEALRKAGWLRGPVPEQKLLDQIRELSSLSLQLETFVAGEDFTPPPTVPYLDLHVDDERQEVSRKGYKKRVKVSGTVAWPMFLAVFSAQGAALSRANLRELDDNSSPAKRTAKGRLNTKLKDLSVVITEDWRLVDTSEA